MRIFPGQTGPALFTLGLLLTAVLATSKGFHIFTTEPFAKSYEAKEGNIAVIEMLFSTSLVALILSPRRLQIQNTKVRRNALGLLACDDGILIDFGLTTGSDNAQYAN